MRQVAWAGVFLDVPCALHLVGTWCSFSCTDYGSMFFFRRVNVDIHVAHVARHGGNAYAVWKRSTNEAPALKDQGSRKGLNIAT
ncbi:hypothetical protein BDP55DRAFT_681329 [Colletotrichum godetiae]|uniref:Secreted protein n=1 Tax=Colletotrichum godetiae TaxID=1209918 RepID=A0AAJ0AAH9_9PEZI|nr:uncharacterized protein BDP55DRAFT_681329 [Colletotrichum godetiae]KAK1658949.1 hypothetical protein BDP55DRAFT_681329 [Colletotrichum godetiae]